MVTSPRPVEPALITIPTSDSAFREHVHTLSGAETPRDLEARLRRIFPRVVVRERTISGAPAWYVYRDGAWSPSLTGDWWEDPRLPRVSVSADGWFQEANATARGLLGIEGDDPSTHYFTDFIVPGTLDDSLNLFRIIGGGKILDATILLRPLSGDVIALDIHAQRVGDAIVAVFRLAGDVPPPTVTEVVGRPAELRFVPATDVAFRSYAQRAVERMPEPTPEGLAIRLHRLYPRATVEAHGGRWIIRRDRETNESQNGRWWKGTDLPRVRYDAEALILEANDAAEAFFGQPLIGHYWQEFVTPGSTDQVGIMLEILADIGAAESRFRMPRGDGRMLEFDSYTETVGDEFVTVFRRAHTP
jgi:PAS domain-containing protein